MAQPRIDVFCLFQSFVEKEYQMESKRNETFGNVIFGTNVIQRTWTLVKTSTRKARGRGARLPPQARPPPSWGPCCSTDVLLPPIYTFVSQTIRYGAKTLFPPPQPSVSTRSHLGACFGAPSEEESIMEGFYIIIQAPPMKCE